VVANPNWGLLQTNGDNLLALEGRDLFGLIEKKMHPGHA
jgi:hypothetical protein